ncbi:hypothetical protein BGW36DRAFT_298878 [Talaromyces proteolyticus]|uniref:SAGA-associated factor 11 n=1 Tax=Talaromyces proteolyticus TaxID=1131652 RepID=A0AAD4PYD5_9EURO|nr:uncharacterized protein BGW36DRAFT_298878 [Talaromyces proteolyticus]KAH8695053.1 hypothetical protein BGW36DRAFT_298878 [Talaromyces proteolyticus]
MTSSDATKSAETDSRVCSASSFSDLSKEILNDTFYNIIHDIVAKVHRDEKIARMRSAVVLARQKAELEAGENPESKVKVETEGAIYDDGKVYLKGNPLATTKETICPYCCLPRLLYPTAGVGARPTPDPSREYCTKHPLISKPGFDVHGNPFATDKTKKKKKATNTSTNTPGSSPPSTPDANNTSKQSAPEFPTIKCPNCPRYFQTNRVTAHLDRCMGLSGRNTTRNRDGASATPTNTGPIKRPFPDGDAAPINPKKKKPNTPKKLGNSKPAPPSKLKNGATPDTMLAEEAAEAAESAEVKVPSEDGIVKTET